jgi:3-oxoacyl-[acyl-carrier protein] reductase
MSDRNLAGRRALITGATRNLGKAAMEELCRRGADVVIVTSSSPELATQIASEYSERYGVSVTTMQADIGFPEQIAASVEATLGEVGNIDIAIECAAIRPFAPLAQITLEDWNRVITTNLTSAFVFAKQLIPGMVERGWGRIIHISGVDGFRGYPNRVHNVTAKAGVHGLTRALAVETAGTGVTVNSIVPGIFATERPLSEYPGWDDAVKAKEIPAGRLGRLSEFAAACAYLASEESSFMTGQALHLNGGTFIA